MLKKIFIFLFILSLTFFSSSAFATTLPIHIINYSLISLNKSWNTTLSANVQQMTSLNISAFSSFLTYNSNFANFEYFYPNNGTIIPSWIESNITGNIIIWTKISNVITTSQGIAIGFANKTTNFLSNTGTIGIGEAPQLSSVYGAYDDGASVFNLYFNFSGTSISIGTQQSGGGWSSYCDFFCSESFATSVNNGLKISFPSGDANHDLFWAQPQPENTIFDWYGTPYIPSNHSAPGNANNGGWGFGGFDNGQPQINMGTCNIATTNYYLDCNSIFSATWAVNPPIKGIYSVAFYSSGSSVATEGLLNYINPVKTNSTASAQTFNLANMSIGWSGGYGTSDVNYSVQWARTRVAPLNNIMPSVSFSTTFSSNPYIHTIITPSSSVNYNQNTIFSINVITTNSLHTESVYLNNTLIGSETGNYIYTLDANTLSAGTYTLNTIDTTNAITEAYNNINYITINKIPIPSFSYSSNTANYDGNTFTFLTTPNTFNNQISSDTNTIPASAGTYSISQTFGNGNYITTTLSNTFVINPIIASNVVWSSNAFTYNGATLTLSATINTINSQIPSFNSISEASAGTYSVNFNDGDGNYLPISNTLVINQATIPSVSWSANTFNYANIEDTLTLTPTSFDNQLPDNSFSAIAGGNYPVTFSVGNGNYITQTFSNTLVINPIAFSNVIILNAVSNTMTYNGANLTFSIMGNTLDGINPTNTFSRAGAGIYPFSLTLNDNGNYLPYTYSNTLVINQATIPSINWLSANTYNYTGYSTSLSAQPVTYGNQIAEISNTFTGAGTYSTSMTFGNGNYITQTFSNTMVIQKALPDEISGVVNITINSIYAVPTYYQIPIVFNDSLLLNNNYQPAILLSSLTAPNLGNIRFQYANSIPLYSYCAFGCRNYLVANSNNTYNGNLASFFYVKLNGLEKGLTPIQMVLNSQNSGKYQYDGNIAGENPDNSSIFGQYDNGKNVFNNYWNFEGNTLPSNFKATLIGNASISVNNGLIISFTTVPLQGGSTITNYASYSLNVIAPSSPFYNNPVWNIYSFINAGDPQSFFNPIMSMFDSGSGNLQSLNTVNTPSQVTGDCATEIYEYYNVYTSGLSQRICQKSLYLFGITLGSGKGSNYYGINNFLFSFSPNSIIANGNVGKSYSGFTEGGGSGTFYPHINYTSALNNANTLTFSLHENLNDYCDYTSSNFCVKTNETIQRVFWIGTSTPTPDNSLPPNYTINVSSIHYIYANSSFMQIENNNGKLVSLGLTATGNKPTNSITFNAFNNGKTYYANIIEPFTLQVQWDSLDNNASKGNVYENGALISPANYNGLFSKQFTNLPDGVYTFTANSPGSANIESYDPTIIANVIGGIPNLNISGVINANVFYNYNGFPIKIIAYNTSVPDSITNIEVNGTIVNQSAGATQLKYNKIGTAGKYNISADSVSGNIRWQILQIYNITPKFLTNVFYKNPSGTSSIALNNFINKSVQISSSSTINIWENVSTYNNQVPLSMYLFEKNSSTSSGKNFLNGTPITAQNQNEIKPINIDRSGVYKEIENLSLNIGTYILVLNDTSLQTFQNYTPFNTTLYINQTSSVAPVSSSSGGGDGAITTTINPNTALNSTNTTLKNSTTLNNTLKNKTLKNANLTLQIQTALSNLTNDSIKITIPNPVNVSALPKILQGLFFMPYFINFYRAIANQVIFGKKISIPLWIEALVLSVFIASVSYIRKMYRRNNSRGLHLYRFFGAISVMILIGFLMSSIIVS